MILRTSDMSESSSGSLCFLRFLGVSVFYFFSRQMHRRDTEGTEKAQRAFTLALIIICLSPLITYSQSTAVRPRMLNGIWVNGVGAEAK